jgi:hypothetical protein
MRRQNILKKFNHCCQVFMITLLLLFVLAFIQAITAGIIQTFYTTERSSNQAQQSQTKALDRQERINRSSRLFLPDGTVHLEYRDNQLPKDQQMFIYDTNDNLIWQGSEDKLPETYLKWTGTTNNYGSTTYLHYLNGIYPDSRKSLVIPIFIGNDIESFWRYEKSGGYFTGFDKNGNCIGYLGSAGFVLEKSQIKPLEDPKDFITWIPTQGGGPLMLWQTEHSIYQIDFGKQVVELLFNLPDKKIKSMNVHGWMQLSLGNNLYLDNQKYRPMILCRTEDGSLFLILREPAETIRINLPEESNAYLYSVTATREKIYMEAINNGLNPPREIDRYSEAYMEWYSKRIMEPRIITDEMYVVNSDGKLTLLNRFTWTSPPLRTSPIIIRSQDKITRFVSQASPALYNLLARLLIKLSQSSLNGYNQGIYNFLRSFMPFIPSLNPVSYLLSLFMAGIVFLHGWPRRKSTIGLIVWIIFAALFNIVGVLVYLALNYTPTIKCHKCNKRRGLNRPQCPHCGADLSQVAPPDKLTIITAAT